MFPPFTDFFAGTRDPTRIACIAALLANRYTTGGGPTFSQLNDRIAVFGLFCPNFGSVITSALK